MKVPRMQHAVAAAVLQANPTLRRSTFSGGGELPPRMMGSGAVRCWRHSSGAMHMVRRPCPCGGPSAGNEASPSATYARKAAASSCTQARCSRVMPEHLQKSARD
eukprot:354857-Chlamydomonas_euryale.AAC.50